MTGLGWGTILRLGLVQTVLGGVAALAISTLNRVMVVEYGLPAMLPAALVALQYLVQLSRPRWGHGSDRGAARTPWIVGGVAVLGLGAVLAAYAVTLLSGSRAGGLALGVLAYTLIGGGMGAAGTSLLALMATGVAPARRAAAASMTWIMMILGMALTSAAVGRALEPFSAARLIEVALGVAVAALAVAAIAVAGIERRVPRAGAPTAAHVDLGAALRSILAEGEPRRFTLFVFLSMLTYSAQELVLEPFAGLVFGLSPAGSADVSAVQHGGVFLGMAGAGLLGSLVGRDPRTLTRWTVTGCAGSALALLVLAGGAGAGPGFPLKAAVFALGAMNGIFAVSAIATMMALAGAGAPGTAGVRMGLWGAAQALGFAVGGFVGAIGVDVGRGAFALEHRAFAAVFAVQALGFMGAAVVAGRSGTRRVQRASAPGGQYATL